MPEITSLRAELEESRDRITELLRLTDKYSSVLAAIKRRGQGSTSPELAVVAAMAEEALDAEL